MAKTGEASILAVADVSKFAAQLQKDLNAAIAGIRLNADSLGQQISKGVKDGVDGASTELRSLGDQSGQTTNVITDNANRAGQSMSAAFKRAGSQMSGIGEQMSMYVSLPLAAAGVATTHTAGDFEQMMNRVKAATEAAGPVFAALRQEAIDLGSSTAFSASEAADGMRIMATAGFNAQQIMEGLPAVLNMASAGAVDLATAAEIGGNILNAYGFAASDLTRINDVLARTFLSTATDLTDLGNSFKYVGPVAKSAGISFEEISAAIGLMGNAGIKGEMAGTALRGALARLLAPTKDVTGALNSLGVKVTDSSGKILPLIDIVRQLEKSGADTADMMTIFGQEAGPGMQALLSQGSMALANLTTQLRNSGGTADKVAKTQMQGLNGSLDELSSSAEGLMIAIGDAGLLGAMTSITKEVTSWVNALAGASPQVLNVITIVGTLLAAAGPLLIFFGKITEAVGVMLPWVKKLGGALKGFGTSALAFFATPAGWVVLAIAAIVAGMVIAYKYSSKFRSIMQSAFQAIGNAGKWLWANALEPAFTGIVVAAKWVWQALQQLWAMAGPVFAAIGRVIVGAWTGQIWPMLQGWGRGFVTAGGMVRSFWQSYVVPAFSAIVTWCRILGQAIGSWWTANGASVFATARGVIAQVGNMIKTIWSGVVAVLQAVGAVVGWVFMNVLVPAAKAVIAVVKLLINVIVAMKPVWIVIGAVIVAAVVVVIAIVKVLWATFVWVFNAVAAIVSWLWGSVIKPVFSFIGAAIQAAAAVIQWLWTNVVAPVVRFIAAAFGALGSALIWLWTSVMVPAWNAIGAIISFVWNSIIMPVFNALQVAVGAVVAVFQWFWNTFGPLFTAVGNLIWTVWSGVISIVFDLLKLAFANIWTVIQLWWAGVQVVFGLLGAIFMWVWNSVVSPVLSGIGSLFTWLWGVIQPVIAAVGAVFSWLWSNAISPVINFVSGALSWLWGVIVTIFNAVVAYIRMQINMIVQAANGVTGFVNSISGHFQAVVNSIRDKIGAAVDFVRGLPGRIIDAVGNVGALLYNAGQNVINGLINGIASRIGALKAKVGEAARAIRDFLPFSPAKEGPLSGSGDPTISGGKIVAMIGEGMIKNVSGLRRAVADVAEVAGIATLAPPVASTATRRSFSEVAAAKTTAVGGSVTRYEITVNALDPKAVGPLVVEAIRGYERANGPGWRK
jgi:TP901 family phage tail tape measure protein